MRGTCALVAGLLAVTISSNRALAKHVEFVSPHPVPHKFGGGFCTIDVPHIHNYPPGDPRLYREDHGRLYFVGDPAPFGYEGPRYSFYGAHPVVDAELHFGYPVYCYLKGPHYHWYQPPAQAQFQSSGGAYWYVGAFPRAYYDERPRHAVINEAYAPVLYARPVVDVAVAPPMVHAEIALGGPGWAAHAVVGGPPVPVLIPPSPPVPVPVGVGINIGGPPVVVETRDAHYHHHDHGRHEGWRNPPERHPRPPARYIAAPAPVRQPLLQRRPGRTPAPRLAPAPRASAAGRANAVKRGR